MKCDIYSLICVINVQCTLQLHQLSTTFSLPSINYQTINEQSISSVNDYPSTIILPMFNLCSTIDYRDQITKLRYQTINVQSVLQNNLTINVKCTLNSQTITVPPTTF